MNVFPPIVPSRDTFLFRVFRTLVVDLWPRGHGADNSTSAFQPQIGLRGKFSGLGMPLLLPLASCSQKRPGEMHSIAVGCLAEPFRPRQGLLVAL